MNILTTSWSKRFRTFHAPDDGGDSGTTVVDPPAQDLFLDTTDPALKLDAPDFSKLKSKASPASEEAKPDDTPEPEGEGETKKGLKIQPEAPEIKKPEPKSKPTEEKKPEDAKPDDVKAAEEAAKKAAEANQSKDAPKELPKDDSDLDSLRPHPNTPKTQITNFDNLKQIAKEARALARQYASGLEATAKELEDLKAKPPTGLTPEVEAELKDLRELRTAVMLENDPHFAGEWNSKLQSADDQLIGFLVENGLPKETADKYKEAGFDNIPWKDVREAITKDPQSYRILPYFDSLMAQRMGLERQRKDEIAKLRSNQPAFIERVRGSEKAAVEKWQKDMSDYARSREGMKRHEWLLLKPVPADATPEQKQAIETENKRLQDTFKVVADQLLPSLYKRDPKVMLDAAMDSMRVKDLEEQLNNLKLDYEAKLEAAGIRERSLETQLQLRKQAGSITQVGDASKPKPPEPKDPNEGPNDAEGSLDEYLKNKRGG